MRSIALPQSLADEVQRHAEEQDKLLNIVDNVDHLDTEEQTHKLEDGTTFPSSGGGVPSSVGDHGQLDRVSEENEEQEDGPENDDGSSEIATGPGRIHTQNRN